MIDAGIARVPVQPRATSIEVGADNPLAAWDGRIPCITTLPAPTPYSPPAETLGTRLDTYA